MSEKRRDSKGRVLANGERQRSDGKYEYRYKGCDGKTHSVYSWKLTPTDKVPSSKKCKESLREMESVIKKNLDEGIDINAALQITMNNYFDTYIQTKASLKPSTLSRYRSMYDRYIRKEFGLQKIKNIKHTDVKRLYIDLLTNRGLKPTTIKTISASIYPVFESAVQDNIIRINPCKGAMAVVQDYADDREQRRKALTIPEQKAFIKFCQNSRKYSKFADYFIFLLGTGCRAGEAAGLTWDNCDFENNRIYIKANLQTDTFPDGTRRRYITTPKSAAGRRTIPMLRDVREALIREKQRCEIRGTNNITVDRYSGFVFVLDSKKPFEASYVDRMIKKIIKEYNSQKQLDNPMLPHFSVHCLRHTFCTRLCETETDLKYIQEIMGHSKISTTMEIYNEVTSDRWESRSSALEGKIVIL